MSNQEYKRQTNAVLEEPPHLLTEEEYRGFSTDNISKNRNGVKITAINSKGIKISGSGDTEQEAVNIIINQIDLLFDQ
ncbi:hypothetical protein [Fodinibius saliphilus]|uniref:hypothetical protein n=1 Tax=Fodinibius saliphilus TaxID=1920650 RepID=UPI001108DF2B|nr:hypothetical protein [Fodinibius saliphilus]